MTGFFMAIAYVSSLENRVAMFSNENIYKIFTILALTNRILLVE